MRESNERRRAPSGMGWRNARRMLALLVATSLRAAAQDNDQCLECHKVAGLKMERNGREVSLHVDPEQFGKSVHRSLDCIGCHAQLNGVTSFPHQKDLARVDCTQCHDDEDGPITAYKNSTHGRHAAEGDQLAPLCQDCHGDHAILRLKNAKSAISPFNVPGMCAQCHAEGAAVERSHDIPQEQVFQRYRDSIHGEGLYKQGLTVTAVCTSCHTGHSVLPHTDPRSTIHKDNVVKTCMKCHGQIEQVHRKVIAGELWEKQGSVPLCVECHSPHEVRKVFYDTNMANADCLRCHATPIKASSDGRALKVDADEHARSIHGRKGVSCAQCHAGATPSVERSCATIVARVNCSTCHEGQVADYNRGVHGSLHNKGDPNAPTCVDCHGTHGILEHAVDQNADARVKDLVRASPTYSRHVPDLCARCHQDGAPAARRYQGNETDIINKYSNSIHGKGLMQSGLSVTAVCTDCHTANRELPASDPDSTVHEGNIAATCGRCHDGIYEEFQKSIHSQVTNGSYVQLRGMPPLPDCNDCHSSHTMSRTDLPAFKLAVIDQCGKCHQAITESYFDTYHGKASALGDTTKAKCYDCHGAHDILPPSQPGSHLSRNHIVATCGKCHAGSNPQFAGYLTHANHHDPEQYPALYWAFVAMTTLLLGTFAFFGLHTLAWLPRSWRMRKSYRQHVPVAGDRAQRYQRFTSYQRSLHLTVILSFFGLAITGMMLKFSYTPWARALSRFLGGIQGAGWIHRVCAIATFTYMALHLVDVGRRFRNSKKTVRQFLFDADSLMPRLSDLKEFLATMKWFIGRAPMPRYGRWTYWEKFDYLAVFWGVVVIGASGLCLWFPESFTRVLPGWAINVATIIHSDEALLATGFIFTIHFFNTHFRPEKFPMDPVIFTGSMSIGELKHDRPALYEQLSRTGELERHLVDAPSPLFTRAARVFGMTALVVGLTLIALIVYAMVFAHR
ncbi:MAG: cytochrome c3 family protein [Planctomycetota bacterium]